MTKEQLIRRLDSLRLRIAPLKALEAEHKRVEAEPRRTEERHRLLLDRVCYNSVKLLKASVISSSFAGTGRLQHTPFGPVPGGWGRLRS